MAKKKRKPQSTYCQACQKQCSLGMLKKVLLCPPCINRAGALRRNKLKIKIRGENYG